jgi:manganese efflux pump family protein
VALAALGLVGLLGASMLALWLRQRAEPPEGRTEPQPPAERHFPPLVVAAHGLFAVATVVLVALTAAGVAE